MILRADGAGPESRGGPATPEIESSGEITVVFVAGAARSGSTLLSRLIGGALNTEPVGELLFLPRQMVMGAVCSCGESLHSCSFWENVGDTGFGGWDQVDLARWEELRTKICRQRFLPWVVLGRRHQGRWDALDAYRDVLASLYRGIARATGSRVIVDSSKEPIYSAVVDSLPGVNVKQVHLIRDSRGVANSLQKKVRRPEFRDRVDYMASHGITRTSLFWALQNLKARAWARSVDSILVRYEDVVRSPEEQLCRIVHLVHSGDRLSEHVDRDRILRSLVELPAIHSVSGNPMRFQSGALDLALDDGWKQDLGSVQKAWITALTWPLLRWHGYALGGWR